MKSAFGALAALLALGACATTTATPPGAEAARDCFHTQSISGYEVIDEHNVAVRVGAHERYIFSTTWNARDLDWTMHIAVRSPSNWICTGNGLGVEIIGGEPRTTYPVSSITHAPATQPEQQQQQPQGS
jgi:hypothetical protein